MILFSVILNVVLALVIIAMLCRFRASRIYFSWKNLSGTFKRITDNIIKGWNGSDLWSVDHWVCVNLLPRLKEFQKIVHGHPAEFSDENEEHSDGMQKWKDIIGKMIFSFECILNDNEDIEYPSIGFEPVERDGVFFMEYVGTPEEIAQHKIDFDIYSEKLKARQVVIQEGLDLFAKHFQGLWD